jgi:hypothetical protein
MANKQRCRADAQIVYQVAKQQPRREQSDFIDLSVEDKLEARKKEITTDRLINFFGGPAQERIELTKWYKSFYSSTYGNVVVLQGTKYMSKSLDEPDVKDSVDESDYESVKFKFPEEPVTSVILDKLWATSIIKNMWTTVNMMSIFTIHQNPLDESFASYYARYIDSDYFLTMRTHNFRKQTKHTVMVNRLHLNSSLSTLCTRLWRDLNLFNGRALEGCNCHIREYSNSALRTEYDNFNSRYIIRELLTHLLRYSLTLGQLEFKQELENMITIADSLSFNMVVLLCVVLRNFTVRVQFNQDVYETLQSFWMDSVIRKFSCDSDNELDMTPNDFKNLLCIYVSLYSLTPLPLRCDICCEKYIESPLHTNEARFELFLQQQVLNINTLYIVTKTTQFIVNTSKNTDTILCCLIFNSCILKYWNGSCHHCFAVAVTSPIKTNLMLHVALLPTEFLIQLILLLEHAFSNTIEKCYISCIRLSCGFIGFICHWMENFFLTRSATFGGNWQSAPVLKTIFDQINDLKPDSHRLLMLFDLKIAPYLNSLLLYNEEHAHTDGFKEVAKTCKTLKYLLSKKND